ncbi:MAG: carbohydrate ABC transporter permease [Microbacteriaceae bacterium]|nr:MAG: carbohydrate ABC transporter permease [Microbacteriaceae bacterium]
MKRRYNPWITRGGLLLMTIFVGFPVYFMVVVSLKTPQDIYRQPSLTPTNPTLENYVQLFQQGFAHNVFNSLIVAAATSVLSTVLGILAAYAIVRLRFPGRNAVSKLILMSYLTPLILLFIPLAVVIQKLNLSDTLLGISIVYLAFTVPLSAWFLLGFFRGMSVDLEEAASLDGANLRQTLQHIVIPMSAPGIATSAILTFTMAWSELFLALVFLTSPQSQTIPVALQDIIQGDVQNYGLIMAGAIVATIPVLILYYFAQRWVITGVAAGATKG